MRSKFFLKAMAFALAALAAHAADIYVATTGNDTTGDGSAANPFETIAAALATASAAGGDTIHVGPGTYPIAAQINIEKPVAIVGAGWQTTTIRMTGSDSTRRILYMSNDLARVSGFTLTGSTYGRYGYPAGFTGGGGTAAFVAGGTLADCRITDNSISYGNRNGFNGAAVNVRGANAVVSRCIIDHNTRSYGTGGGCGLRIDRGLAENCLVYANNGGSGVGVYIAGDDSHLRNCTVAGNRNTTVTAENLTRCQGAGLYSEISSGSTIVNCVFAGNTSVNPAKGDGGAEWYAENKSKLSAAMSHCAVLNDGVSGALGADAIQLSESPFVDAAGEDFRLRVTSPLIDAGAAVVETADIDGNPRANGATDIGCHESQATGLRAGITPGYAPAFAGAPVAFAPVVRGTNGTDEIAFAWSLENATTGVSVDLGPSASAEVLAAAAPTPGRYTLALSVRNATAGGEWVAAETASLYVNARTNYVSAVANPDAAFPWDTPATAANSIQEVVDAAIDGGTILLSEGAFPISSEIFVEKAITLLGRGRNATLIRNTADGKRVLFLNHRDAFVGGVTLADGKTASGTFNGYASSGGLGVFIQAGTLADACVTNCTTSYGNATKQNGAAVEVATSNARVSRTIICNNRRNSNNTAKGGGLRLDGGTADNCLVYGNTGGYGAGVYIGIDGGKLLDCTVVGNTCNGKDDKYQGAGLYFDPTSKGVAEIANCVFAHNAKTSGTISGNGGAEWYAANSTILAAAVKNCAFLSDASTGSAAATGTGSFTFTASDEAFAGFDSKDFSPARGGVLHNVGLYNAARMDGAADLFGNPRVDHYFHGSGLVDIGAIETPYRPPATRLMVR